MKKIKQFVFYGKKVRDNLGKECFPANLNVWQQNLLTDLFDADIIHQI